MRGLGDPLLTPFSADLILCSRTFDSVVNRLTNPAMRECPRCECCFEDDVVLCPQDQAKTKQTLPGPRLLAARYLLEKRLTRRQQPGAGQRMFGLGLVLRTEN